MPLRIPRTLPIGGFTLELPCFFPAISSVKANFSTLEYLSVITAIDYPQCLISAYDIANCPPAQRTQIEKLLHQRTESSIILLDSGNYEKYWLRDPDWTQERFFSVLGSARCQLAFCYDNQTPPISVSVAVDQVESALIDADNVSLITTVLPIVHGPVGNLVDVVKGVAEKTHPMMLAVPERILGDGLIARARKVFELRQALNELDQGDTALHLLGTGNPLSMMVYSLSGANSFDGLEWCQTTVDPSTGFLFHFQQRELFEDVPEMFHLDQVNYSLATMSYNLVFYKRWMSMLSKASITGSWAEMCERYLPDSFVRRIQREVPEIEIHGV